MKNMLVTLLLLPYLVLGQLSTDYKNDQQNGIFFGKANLQLFPTVLGGIQNKNTALAILSFGIVRQSRLPFLSFAQSNHIVAEPQFQFRFQRPLHNEFGFLEPERSFRGAVSPNEFLLLKLTPNTKRNLRYILRQINGWTSRSKAELIPFGFAETQAGIFEVHPFQILERGEYGFVHKDILVSDNFADFMIFDFSVE